MRAEAAEDWIAAPGVARTSRSRTGVGEGSPLERGEDEVEDRFGVEEVDGGLAHRLVCMCAR